MRLPHVVVIVAVIVVAYLVWRHRARLIALVQQ